MLVSATTTNQPRNAGHPINSAERRLMIQAKPHVQATKSAFSNNRFDMVSGVERMVEVTLEKPLKPSELRKRLQFIFYH